MKYIVRDPEIMGGAPVITGTRIPAIRLIWLMRHGYTEQNIREEFPHVSAKKLRGALTELLEHAVEQLDRSDRDRRSSKSQTLTR